MLKEAISLVQEKHPHVCGEDRRVRCRPPATSETPPRVWGRLTRQLNQAKKQGNTPTCVGKTAFAAVHPAASWKHPHVCGEDHRRSPCPLMSGGNTPTCVGKTFPSCSSQTASWKHPHVCGEDFQGDRFALRDLETPPRVWGRPRPSPARMAGHRNTPTCVGKTWLVMAFRAVSRKHPHVCGEDQVAAIKNPSAGETPPRVWERPSPSHLPYPQQRNTPTCVGKTNEAAEKPDNNKKHPHVCGEDFAHDWAGKHYSETPPRVWGRPRVSPNSANQYRNTPTCVGKTSPVVASAVPKKKHPHVCGEDKPVCQIPCLLLETPPRVWGRPESRGIKIDTDRNTPTCVGKTKSV